MPKKVEMEMTDFTYKKIMDVVRLENEFNRLSKNKKKERSVESFIKGAVVQTLCRIDGYEEVRKLYDLSDPEKALKNRFKEIAAERGVSQSLISERTKIHPTNLNQIFNNKSQPRMDYFFRIWGCLDFPPIHKCFYKED